MTLNNEDSELYLHVSDEVDANGEIKIIVGSRASGNYSRCFISIDEACKLRDHLNKVIDKVK